MRARDYSLRSMFHADAKVLDGLSATNHVLRPATPMFLIKAWRLRKENWYNSSVCAGLAVALCGLGFGSGLLSELPVIHQQSPQGPIYPKRGP
jgi:hypothetical protein